MPASAAATAATVVELSIDQLVPSPHNPRRVIPGDPKVAEMAESMKTHGVLQPLLVRRHPNAGDVLRANTHEILAGERRWHAAQLAGLETVPVMIKECTDAEALDITVIENLHREQLHPLEECRGVASLVRSGRRTDEIAAAIGKSEKWVVLRAKVAELDPAWLEAIGDQEHPASKLTIGHLELVARLPREVHLDVLKMAEEFVSYDGAAMPIKEMRDTLNQELLNDLRHAPWDQDDAELVPAAGACSACPHRSSLQGTLFPDLKEDPEIRGKKKVCADRCLNRPCWQAKQRAFIDLRKADVAEKLGGDLLHPMKVLEISHESKPTEADQVSSFAVKVVSKDTKGALPAIETVGKEAGKLKYILPHDHIATSDPHTRKAFGIEKPKAKTAGESPVDQVAAIAEKRRDFIWDRIDKCLSDKKGPLPTVGNLVRLTLLVTQPYDSAEWNWKRVLKHVASDKPSDAELREWWDMLREQLSMGLGHDIEPADEDAGHEALCAMLELDYADLKRLAIGKHPDGSVAAEPPKAKAIVKKRTVKAAKNAAKTPAKKGKRR